jgi:hypothetical protein
MNVDTQGDERFTPSSPINEVTDDAPRRARTAPGVLAVVAALVFAVVHVVAIAEAAGGNYRSATILAWIAIGGTTATLLTGVAALVLDRGRRWSAVAVILSLFANPFVLTQILRFFDPARS